MPANLKRPQRSDQGLNFATYDRVVQAALGWLATVFNPAHFKVDGANTGRRTISLANVSTPAFSGVAYVRGQKNEDLNTDKSKLWVKINLETATATQETGPPASPFPAGEEWYEKSKTYGDIHIP